MARYSRARSTGRRSYGRTLLAGVLAAQLTLAGVPDECAAQVANVVGKLFGW